MESKFTSHSQLFNHLAICMQHKFLSTGSCTFFCLVYTATDCSSLFISKYLRRLNFEGREGGTRKVIDYQNLNSKSNHKYLLKLLLASRSPMPSKMHWSKRITRKWCLSFLYKFLWSPFCLSVSSCCLRNLFIQNRQWSLPTIFLLLVI